MADVPSSVSTLTPFVSSVSDIGPLFHKSTATVTNVSNQIIAPRHFNDLIITDTAVTKTSLSTSIHGELHFYRNIPTDLKDFFPTLLAYTVDPTSIKTSRVHGLTLSTLLTTGQLQPSHIEYTLKNLYTMHTFAPYPHVSLIYANHCKKVNTRFRIHERTVYKAVGLTAENHFESLLCRLSEYETSLRARPASMIHGDPVLTNIICEAVTGELKFIDMRGAQGGCLTIAGDAIYDLAKLLQSLLGYDFILGNVPMDITTISRLSSLLSVYWMHVNMLYPGVRVNDVVTVCCALYSSLIPLHKDEGHRRRFAIMATVLLDALDTNDVGDGGSHLVRRAALRLSCTS